MVYCSKCGTNNPEDAKVCTQCGVSLYPGAEPIRRQEGPREKECFGLPNSGAIAGIVFGILIILWGLSLFFGWELNIMVIIAVIFGTLIVAGSIYKLTRGRS